MRPYLLQAFVTAIRTRWLLRQLRPRHAIYAGAFGHQRSNGRHCSTASHKPELRDCARASTAPCQRASSARRELAGRRTLGNGQSLCVSAVFHPWPGLAEDCLHCGRRMSRLACLIAFEPRGCLHEATAHILPRLRTPAVGQHGLARVSARRVRVPPAWRSVRHLRRHALQPTEAGRAAAGSTEASQVLRAFVVPRTERFAQRRNGIGRRATSDDVARRPTGLHWLSDLVAQDGR